MNDIVDNPFITDYIDPLDIGTSGAETENKPGDKDVSLQ